MTTLDHAHHIIRRRAYAPHYTSANVAKFQPEIHELMCEVLNVSGQSLALGCQLTLLSISGA